MQLDDLQQLWTAHGASLEGSLAINEQLLRVALFRQVRSSLVPFRVWRTLEVIIGVATIILAMSVLADHVTDPRYVIVAGGVAVLAAWVTARCALVLVHSSRINYADSVTTLQRNVEQIRLAEYRAFKATLLAGLIGWLPGTLILVEALTGMDALTRVHWAWLVANVIVGLVCLIVGQALSWRYIERSNLRPWARNLLESLSGRALQSATQNLADLARFSHNA